MLIITIVLLCLLIPIFKIYSGNITRYVKIQKGLNNKLLLTFNT